MNNNKNLIDIVFSEENRSQDEDFLRTLTSRDKLRLYFSRGNEAFTDGYNIVVDPLFKEIYREKSVLKKACVDNSLSPIYLKDDFVAIKFITKALELHEAFHVLYSRFDIVHSQIIKYNFGSEYKKNLFHEIQNLIEDSFVEIAGTTQFDNTEIYIRLLNSILLNSSMISSSSKKNNISKKEIKEKELFDKQGKRNQKKIIFIHTFLYLSLVEVIWGAKVYEIKNKALKTIFNKARKIYKKAVIETDAITRLEYAKEIYDLLEKHIPPIDDPIKLDLPLINPKSHNGIKKTPSDEPEKIIPEKMDPIYKPVGSSKTQNNEKKNSESNYVISILKPATSDDEYLNQEYIYIINFYESMKKRYVDDGYEIRYNGEDLHKGFVLIEKKYPSSNENKKVYNEIVSSYLLLINKFSKRFANIISEKANSTINKQLSGNSIMSSRLWDIKKRYWVKNVEESIVPDLSVMLFIDASGSMSGPYRASTIFSAVILSEVLERNKIKYSIVEHNSVGTTVNVNILKPFKSKSNDKYNILLYYPYSGTRDGFSLFWAQRYFKKYANTEKKLIIALTDGLPSALDYHPPISIIDTHNSVIKLQRSGIEVVGINISPYKEDSLGIKAIYDNYVLCENIEDLPIKILDVISKLIK